ncbi:MAG: thermonuclease family protein [Zoogloeaceae bacterium]|nr:thermonuclease family protein [Zoogloeaceae bacterium]
MAPREHHRDDADEERRQRAQQRPNESGKQARLEITGRDRYGRRIGRMKCGNKAVNAEQVRRGLAWVDSRYTQDKALTLLQAEARKNRTGLWSNPAPVPPWQWRANHATAMR